MAACATSYFEAGRSWSARVAERNAELMAQQALRRRGMRTPEFIIPKRFDNSRLVKAADAAMDVRVGSDIQRLVRRRGDQDHPPGLGQGRGDGSRFARASQQQDHRW